jgi:hypothetical protein
LIKRAWLCTLSAIALCVVLLKLFSTEITFRDDPTHMLAFRAVPSLENYILLDDLNSGAYYVFSVDENDLIEGVFYSFVVDYLSYLLVFVCIGLWFIYCGRKRQQTHL